MLVERKRLKRLFDALDFTSVQALLLEAYHQCGPGRQFYDPEAVVKALMLQLLEGLTSERVLTEELAKCRDYRRICRFKRKTPSRGCFTYFRRRRLGVGSFIKVFNAMLEQALALGAVKGYAFAVDSTAYSARDASNKRGRSDPDADVGMAGRTYVLGYRVHLACAEGDEPLAFTVQPISRNDKPFLQAPTREGLERGRKVQGCGCRQAV